jgi:hypothetical protein
MVRAWNTYNAVVVERDILLTVLGSDIGLLGLILVFAGLVSTKADSMENSRRGDRFRWLARASLVPLIAALLSAWISIDAVEGSTWAATYSLCSLKIVLALTGFYAIIATALTSFP